MLRLPGPALFKNVQLLQPSHKGMCCSMGLFLALRAFDPVQDFVSLIDSWPNLLFTSKASRVVEVADDASIFEMQLRREIKLGRHTSETSSVSRGSHRLTNLGRVCAENSDSERVVRLWHRGFQSPDE